MGQQFRELTQQEGVAGAFARGFTGFGAEVDRVLGLMRNARVELPGIQLPDMPGDIQAPRVTGGPTTLPGAILEGLRQALTEQAELLTAQAGAWEAIVGSARQYLSVARDHGQATRAVVVALSGQLDTLNQLGAVQRQSLYLQRQGSKEWFDGLRAVHETAQGVAKVRDEIRNLIFDTSQLSAMLNEQEKLWQLGQQAGFDPESMAQMAAAQGQLLTQTLLIERARLATLEAGTQEWFKQRGAVVDIIARIVRLRKELEPVNAALRQPMLARPGTPWGVRGSGPELGWMQPSGGSDLGRLTAELLRFALNPAPVSIDAQVRQMFAQGNGPQLLPGASPDHSATIRAPTMAVNPTINIGSVNDVETIKRIAWEITNQGIEHAFRQIVAVQRNRFGE